MKIKSKLFYVSAFLVYFFLLGDIDHHFQCVYWCEDDSDDDSAAQLMFKKQIRFIQVK